MKDFLTKIGNFFVNLFTTFKENYLIIILFVIIAIFLFFLLHLIWESKERKNKKFRYRK